LEAHPSSPGCYLPECCDAVCFTSNADKRRYRDNINGPLSETDLFNDNAPECCERDGPGWVQFCATLAQQKPCCYPPNDRCAGALPLLDGMTRFDTVDAASGAAASWCHDGPKKDLWYAYNATANGVLTLSTTSDDTNFDTILGVWVKCPPAGDNVVGPNDLCQDDVPTPPGTRSHLQVEVHASPADPLLLYVQLGGFQEPGAPEEGQTGVGTLSVSFEQT